MIRIFLLVIAFVILSLLILFVFSLAKTRAEKFKVMFRLLDFFLEIFFHFL